MDKYPVLIPAIIQILLVVLTACKHFSEEQRSEIIPLLKRIGNDHPYDEIRSIIQAASEDLDNPESFR